MTAIGGIVTDLLVTALRKILQLRYRKHAAPSDEDFAVAVDLGGRDRGHAVIAEIFSPKVKKCFEVWPKGLPHVSNIDTRIRGE